MNITIDINAELQKLLQELKTVTEAHPFDPMDRNLTVRNVVWAMAIRAHGLAQLYRERFGSSPQSDRAIEVAEAFIRREVFERARRNATLDDIAAKHGAESVKGLYE